MCIHCNARGRHESRRAHSASWRSIYTRSKLSFWKRIFYFSARKKLKGSPVVVSVATAKVEGRRRSWTGGEGCTLDPFDATDEPSGCSPSQAAIRRTMIVFNHQFGKFSHSCCVDTAISALIFEGKFPILAARFISEQSRPSARPGRENGCACRSVQRDARATSTQPRWISAVCPVVWGALLHAFFSLLAMKQFKVCLSESVLCLQKCALRFFYMHGMCW